MRRLLLLSLLLSGLATQAQVGYPDSFFHHDGIVITDINSTDDVATSLLIQPDGKIVAAGYTTDSFNRFCLVRYLHDGNKDNTFGNNGVVTTVFAPSDGGTGEAIAMQTDGKIIVAGTVSSVSSAMAVVRYHTDGSLDNTFGSGGVVSTGFPTGIGFASSVLIQADGKIVVGGAYANQLPDGFAWVLRRFLPDGSLDLSYGTAGAAVFDITTGPGLGSLDVLEDMALQPDGKIVAAGISGPFAVLVRIKPNGTADSSFGTNGIVMQNYSATGNSGFSSVAVQADGKIVSGGSYTAFATSGIIARFTSSGLADAGFGTSGLVTTQLSGVAALTLQPDGKIAATGPIEQGGDIVYGVARYSTAGAADANFGTGGLTTTNINPGGTAYPNAIALHADGKVVVAGGYHDGNSDFALARYAIAPLSVTDKWKQKMTAALYPNPAGNTATLTYKLDRETPVTITMQDGKGALVKLVSDRSMRSAGTHKETIDLSNLATGTYLLNITTQDGNQAIKLVKE